MVISQSAIVALDHLVYQNDNCRIFYCNAEFHYEQIQTLMNALDEEWFLATETNYKSNTWLIYLRK